MRLAQLARKLSVKTSDVVDFFATHSIFVEDAPNSKIEDDHTRRAIIHFAPHLLEEQVQELAHQPDEMVQADNTPVETTLAVASTDTEWVTRDVSDEGLTSDLNATEELPDIIRAPKVELTGLKVLGKIELPEKKKKEEPAVPEGESSEAKPAVRERRKPNKQTSQRNGRNQISDARERELREIEEKRKQEEEQRKELRKQSYLRTREAKAPTKRQKQALTKLPAPAAIKNTKPEPTTWLGRFLRWLTSNQ